MTLTELCLSFDRSMDLTKSGIILVGCCFCWVRDNDDQQIKLIEASRMMDINDLKGEVTFLSHAPTAGELEEWLITVFGFGEILTNFNPCDPHSERRWMVLGSLHPEQTVQHAYGSTHAAALAALVLEVAG